MKDKKIVAETSTRPVNTSIKNTSEFIKPFDEIKVAYEDIPYCAEHRKEWQERWTNILTKILGEKLMSVNIKIENAQKRYGDNIIIENLSLDIKQGEFLLSLDLLVVENYSIKNDSRF